MSNVASADRPRALAVRRGALALLWLALAFYYLTPVSRVLEPDLDSSIHATYAYFTAHGYQFGSQVNTTAGPYGFVMFGWDYSGQLYYPRLLLELGFTLGLSALILWMLCAAARSSVWHWLWLAAVLVELSVGDTLFTFAILLCSLYLIVNYRRPDRRWSMLAATIYLAFLSLVKGTQLAEAFGGLIGVGVAALLSRQWRPAGRIYLTFLGAMIAWWIAAGQNPLHLPGYIQGIRHIAQGYNAAMAIETPAALLCVGAGLAIALLALAAWNAWQWRRSPEIVGGCVVLAGFSYVSWKHGYVRSDGHMFIFIDFAGVAALTFPLLPRMLDQRRGQLAVRTIGAVFSLGVLALGLYGSRQLAPERLQGLARDIGPRLVENVVSVATAPKWKAAYDVELRLRRADYNHLRVREAVGRHTIDLIGYDLGRILLNGFNYDPTPMCCGTYHVYNAYFKDLNYRHFIDPTRRPDFLLLHIQQLDDRFVAMDDSLSLLAILNDYRPLFEEDEAVLLEAQPGSVTPVNPKLQSRRAIKFGETVESPEVSPDEMLLFSIDIPSSFEGGLRALAYKPPVILMDLEGDGLTQKLNQRVIASSIAVPTLLNPTLESNDDVVALWAGRTAKKVRRLRLHTSAPECFDAQNMAISFYTVPRPRVLGTAPLKKYYAASVFRDAPDSIDPVQPRNPYYHDERVQYVASPTRVTFALRGDEREFDFRMGIKDEAYTDGRVDGVTFTVWIEQPGQGPQMLARRGLQPRYVPADRGFHSMRAPLPPAYQAGSKLIFETSPVPNGGIAWGWSFITHARFIRGAFLFSQFPGFDALPSGVESAGCGIIPEKERNVLMTIPPTDLTFPLPSTATELTFTAGIEAAAYTNNNRTDGAEFIVDYVHADGSVTHVFRRWLNPLSVAADRGDQTMTASLSPQPPGTSLRLRVTTGPYGNNAWDWVYMTKLSLH